MHVEFIRFPMIELSQKSLQKNYLSKYHHISHVMICESIHHHRCLLVASKKLCAIYMFGTMMILETKFGVPNMKFASSGTSMTSKSKFR